MDYANNTLRETLYLQANKNTEMSTEAVLNRVKWVDGQGTIHEPSTMEKEHLQNVLFYLYKNRDKYWLRCKNSKIIEEFENGEQFFQFVIRKSTIWKVISQELIREDEGFNFEYTIPEGKEDNDGNI